MVMKINMNLYNVIQLRNEIINKCNFEETMKIFREILYVYYSKLNSNQQTIDMYYLLRNIIDIFTQMYNGRVFNDEYLKGIIKWY